MEARFSTLFLSINRQHAWARPGVTYSPLSPATLGASLPGSLTVLFTSKVSTGLLLIAGDVTHGASEEPCKPKGRRLNQSNQVRAKIGACHQVWATTVNILTCFGYILHGRHCLRVSHVQTHVILTEPLWRHGWILFISILYSQTPCKKKEQSSL